LTKKLKLADEAPDFTLFNQNKKEIKLSEFKGKKVLLSFHPLAWTGICAKQMQSLEAHADKFEELGIIPLGISIDSVPSKRAWAESLGIEKTSLVCDFWPHGKLAKDLGIFREDDGISERANIIIDENQIISFIKIYNISELPDIKEILLELEK